MGAAVEARYRGKKKFYAGKVAAVKDGKYTIDYDDGETEKGVAEEMIRALEQEDEPPAKRDAAPALRDSLRSDAAVRAVYADAAANPRALGGFAVPR